MKKSIRTVALMLLFAMLFSSLTACNGGGSTDTVTDGVSDTTNASGTSESTTSDPEQSAQLELIRQIEEKSNDYYSNGYKQESTIHQKIEGTMSGFLAASEISASTLHATVGADDDAVRSIEIQTVEATTTSSGIATTKYYTATKAYSNGYMYYGYKSDEKNTFLKSPVEPDDYNTYYPEYESGIEEPNYLEVCEKATVVLSDDKKTYTVTFSQTNKTESEAINEFVNKLTEAFGAEFDLVRFTYEITADAETLIMTSLKTEIKTIYINGDDELIHTYSLNGTISRTEEDFDTTPENADSYVETGDLRYIEIASKALDGIISSNDKSFKYTRESSITAGSNTQKTYSEESKVNCGIKNGVYVQYITQKVKSYGNNWQEYTHVFDGVKQTRKEKSSPETTLTDMTEAGARMFLSSFIDELSLTPSDISSISVNKTAKNYAYVDFYLHFEKSDYDYIFASLGTKVTDGYVKIYTALDNTGRLMNAKYEFYVETVYRGQKCSQKSESIISKFGKADLSEVTPIKPGSSEL